MKLVICSMILSFFLESITSNFVTFYDSLFIPLFSVVSLIIICPYFKGQEGNYIKLCALFGLCYDIVYTDTLFMNFLLFLFLGYMIRGLNHLLSMNVINVPIMVVCAVILYRVCSYGILCLAGFLTFHMENLTQSILSSLLSNVIYGVVLYWITDQIAKHYHIYKVD